MIIDFDCKKCKYYNTEVCEECSGDSGERGCSCHINPPCGFCERMLFEEKE